MCVCACVCVCVCAVHVLFVRVRYVRPFLFIEFKAVVHRTSSAVRAVLCSQKNSALEGAG